MIVALLLALLAAESRAPSAGPPDAGAAMVAQAAPESKYAPSCVVTDHNSVTWTVKDNAISCNATCPAPFYNPVVRQETFRLRDGNIQPLFTCDCCYGGTQPEPRTWIWVLGFGGGGLIIGVLLMGAFLGRRKP